MSEKERSWEGWWCPWPAFVHGYWVHRTEDEGGGYYVDGWDAEEERARARAHDAGKINGRDRRPQHRAWHHTVRAAYLRGYREGFLERKVRKLYPHSRGFEPGDNGTSWVIVLRSLMTRPRVTVKRHPRRWTRYYRDGSYEYMEPEFDRTRIVTAGGYVEYGPYLTFSTSERSNRDG